MTCCRIRWRPFPIASAPIPARWRERYLGGLIWCCWIFVEQASVANLQSRRCFPVPLSFRQALLIASISVSTLRLRARNFRLRASSGSFSGTFATVGSAVSAFTFTPWEAAGRVRPPASVVLVSHHEILFGLISLGWYDPHANAYSSFATEFFCQTFLLSPNCVIMVPLRRVIRCWWIL
jgi:hypothetical protein